MKYLSRVLFLIVLFVVSCSSDDGEDNTDSPSNRLLDCHIHYLLFKDDIRLTNYNNIVFHEVDSVTYNYENGFASRVVGGFMYHDPAINSGLRITNRVSDSIVKVGNTYKVYILPAIPYMVQDVNPENPIEYVIVDYKIQKITRRDGFVFDYVYEDNVINEIYAENGVISRTFYLENGNLIKIEKFTHNFNLELIGQTEMLFQDYDSNPNPFKGKYYLIGSFFHSFSENNFRSIEVNKFNVLDDGSFVLESSNQYSMLENLDYNSDGYPLFGNYE